MMGSTKDDLKLGLHPDLDVFYSLESFKINQNIVLLNSSKREY